MLHEYYAEDGFVIVKPLGECEQIFESEGRLKQDIGRLLRSFPDKCRVSFSLLAPA